MQFQSHVLLVRPRKFFKITPEDVLRRICRGLSHVPLCTLYDVRNCCWNTTDSQKFYQVRVPIVALEFANLLQLQVPSSQYSLTSSAKQHQARNRLVSAKLVPTHAIQCSLGWRQGRPNSPISDIDVMVRFMSKAIFDLLLSIITENCCSPTP